MIEVSFSDGATVYLANLAARLKDLATRRCERCGAYFTGPGPIIRGARGQTVIVCQGCKEAHVAERETVGVKRDTLESAEVLGG